MQSEKLDEWLEKQKSIGSFVLAIPIVPLVNISSMSFEYRVRRCMVLLELLYFNACSTVTKFNCNIENMKHLKFNSQQTFLEGSLKKEHK